MKASEVFESVSTFQNLVSLDASGNNLYGPINHKAVLAVNVNLLLIPTFTSLVTLRISSNSIERLPESFTSSSSSSSTAKFFTALYANNNNLSGSFPSYYFEQLDIINLHHNPGLYNRDGLPSSVMHNMEIRIPEQNCQCPGVMATNSRGDNVAWAVPPTCKRSECFCSFV